MERLQKFMAESGVASRRKSEEIIAQGRVKVNGQVITEMGYKVNDNDIVTVDDKQIAKVHEKKYYAINKPRGVVSTANDPEGRKTVLSILPDELKGLRLFPVGRLDYDTKGILILTNDGDFMNELVGPKSNTEKEYLVRVKGILEKDDLRKLERGVLIKDEKGSFTTRPCKAKLDSVDDKNGSCLVRLIINEGKYHQVKRMIEAIGFVPVRLTRVRFGRITVDGLGEGEVRELSVHEVKSLIGDQRGKKEYKPRRERKQIEE